MKNNNNTNSSSGDNDGSCECTESGSAVAPVLSRKSGLLLLTTLSISNLFAAVSFSVISPFFPGEANNKGVSLFLSGAIIGVFEFVIFLVSPFVVMIAAPVGNNFVYICGLFICGTCSVLFGFLEYCPGGTIFAVMCFLTRCIGAFGACVFLVASFAIMTRAFPDKVSTVSGIVETALGVGYMVGPAVGGFLYDVGGFKLPMFVVGSLVLVTAAVALFATPTLPIDEDEHERPAPLLKFMALPVVLATLLSYVVIGGLYGTLDIAMEPYLTTDFHYSPTVIGLIFLIPSLVYSLSAVVWGHLADTMGWGIRVLVGGLLASAIGAIFIDPPKLLFTFSPTLYALVPGLVAFGLGSGAVMVPIYALCLEEAYKNGFQADMATMNLVSGVTSSAYSLGVFLGPTLGGQLYDSIGFDNMLVGYAGLFLLSAFLLGLANMISRYWNSNSPVFDNDEEGGDVVSETSDVTTPNGLGDLQPAWEVPAANHSRRSSVSSTDTARSRSRRSSVTSTGSVRPRRNFSVSSLASHYSHQFSVQIPRGVNTPSASRSNSSTNLRQQSV